MHTITKLTIMVSIVFAILATFFLVKTTDDASPAGAETYFSVVSVNGNESKAANASALTQAAKKAKLTVVKLTADPKNVMHGRVLYVFPSSATSTFDRDFQRFSASTTTQILPSTKIEATDLRGLYYTEAGYGPTTRLLSLLNQAGMTTQYDQSNPTSFAASKVFSTGGFVSAFIAALMALVLGIFYSVTFAAKATAIRYLSGYSPATVTLNALGQVSRTFWLSALASTFVTAIVLVFYNGFSLAGDFFAHLLAVLAGLYVLVVLLLLASFAYQAETPILAVIKGRRPVKSLGILSGAIQVVMVVALVGGSAAASANLRTYRADAAQSASWVHASNAVTLRFSPNLDETRYKQVEAKFGDLIRSEDSSGHAIVSVHQTDPDTSFRPDTGNVILVNSQYLRAQDVVGENGQRIKAVQEKPGTATLLIPESARSQTPAIKKLYSAFFHFQLSEIPGSNSQVSLQVKYLKSPAKAFNYGGTFMLTGTTQTNPVIVVVPANSGLLSDDYYASVASTGNILFDNYSVLREDIKTLGLSSDVLSIDRASDAALADLSKRRSQIALSEAALGADLIVFALASLLLASVYCEANKQQLFARFISGQRFLQKHGLYLAATVIGVGTAAFLTAFHAKTQPQLAVALSLGAVIFSAAISAGAINVYEKAFRGDAVKRY